MSADLSTFLLARIAEDEAVARAATRSPWVFDPAREAIYAPEVQTSAAHLLPEEVVGGDNPWLPLSNAEHIARHDPARVLAECEAKRRIVELAEEASGLDMQVDSEFRVGPRDEASEPYAGDVILRALALPYADHPDYDEAWRP